MSYSLDMRISEHNNGVAGVDQELNTIPALVGDLGIQTTAAIGTPEADDVRVWLSGSLTCYKQLDAPDETTFTVVIERDGNGTFGSGTVIYQTDARPGNASATAQTVSITAGDFPSATLVANGQIRYSLFIYSNTDVGMGAAFLYAASFNGIAYAG